MGFFDGWDGSSVISSSKSHKHSKSSKHRSSKRSRSRSRSRARGSPRRHHSHHSSSGLGNFLGGGSHYNKHNSSRSSFFNLGNNSSRSLFGLGGRSNSSFYKRSPRSSFVQRMYRKLKRLLRDLVYYAKRHPWKVFMIVLMPLITGGALTALLARFGLRLPPTIEKWLGVAARAGSGDGIGLVSEAVRMVGGSNGGAHIERGRDGGLQWERRSEWDYGSGGSSRGGGGGFMDSVYRFFD